MKTEAQRKRFNAQRRAYYAANPGKREKVVARAKAWYEANREKGRARSKAHYAANKEKYAAAASVWRKKNKKWISDYSVAYRKANPERIRYHVRNAQRKRSGMNPIDAEKLMDGAVACDICGVSGKRLVPDHDHATGQIRGVLCVGCNTAIGLLGDTAEGLQRAIAYLTPGPKVVMYSS